MLKIGRFQPLRIYKIVEFGAYLTDGANEVLLPLKYLPRTAAVDTVLDVFVYLDSEDRPVATTLQPKGVVGDIVKLRVKEMTRFGAFLDWGLEKDLFVPFGEMDGKEMAPGRDYVVAILFDPASKRIIGSNRFDRLIRKFDADTLEINRKLTIVPYEKTAVGFKVIGKVSGKNLCQGMIYHNEIFQPVAIGDALDGYVAAIRPDHRVDFRLRPAGRAAVFDHRQDILDQLQTAGGFLPFTAKTDAIVIKGRFRISKKLFKEIIGNLYKDRLISISDDGITLLPPRAEPK